MTREEINRTISDENLTLPRRNNRSDNAMPFALVEGNVLEVKFYSRCEGQVAINVRHYVVDDIVGAGRTDAQMLDVIAADIAPRIQALLNEEAFYLGTSLQIIRLPRRPALVRVIESGAGTYAGEALPKQVAGLIKLVSADATRHGRGRFYAPFPSENANGADARPNAGYMDALDDLGEKLASPQVSTGGADSATAVPVIYNRTTHAVIRILDNVERQLWATQRRRSDVRGGDRLPF